MHKLTGVKCRLNLVLASKSHIVKMFKVEIHVRNVSADVSKKQFDKIKCYITWFFYIDITVKNYNLPCSLKGGVHAIFVLSLAGSQISHNLEVCKRRLDVMV